MARRLQRAVRASSLVGLGELLEVGKVVGAQLVDDAGQQVLQLCEGATHAGVKAARARAPLHSTLTMANGRRGGAAASPRTAGCAPRIPPLPISYNDPTPPSFGCRPECPPLPQRLSAPAGGAPAS